MQQHTQLYLRDPRLTLSSVHNVLFIRLHETFNGLQSEKVREAFYHVAYAWHSKVAVALTLPHHTTSLDPVGRQMFIGWGSALQNSLVGCAVLIPHDGPMSAVKRAMVSAAAAAAGHPQIRVFSRPNDAMAWLAPRARAAGAAHCTVEALLADHQRYDLPPTANPDPARGPWSGQDSMAEASL